MAARQWSEEQRKQQSLNIRQWQRWQRSTGAKTLWTSPNIIDNSQLDFPRFSRQLIMSEINQRKLHEGYQIHSRI